MTNSNRLYRQSTVVVAVYILAAAVSSSLQAQPSNPFAEVDRVVVDFMAQTRATAATVAISFENNTVYAKGYGFSDRRQRIATQSTAVMRLASCTKPFTRALIRKLAGQGHFSLHDRVFEYLDLRPQRGEIADPRVLQITIQNLIDHQTGWDSESTFDPMFESQRIRSELGSPGKLTKKRLVRFMWQQPLQTEPGGQRHYSNFGYVLLGLVVEKATGKSYIQSLRQEIGQQLGISDFSISSSDPTHRVAREVFYPQDSDLSLRLRDSASGLATSAISMNKFMMRYWMDGTRRNQHRMYFHQAGTHPFTTTALMEQRRDGINFALLLNSRRNEEDYDADNQQFRARFNQLIELVKPQIVHR